MYGCYKYRHHTTGGSVMNKNELVKVTVNLTEENSEIVNQLSNEQKVNKTTIINKAIALEKFISDALKNEQKIMIVDKDGTRREIVFR